MTEHPSSPAAPSPSGKPPPDGRFDVLDMLAFADAATPDPDDGPTWTGHVPTPPERS